MDHRAGGHLSLRRCAADDHHEHTARPGVGDENRAFFTASHAVVAIMIGYGLALMAAYMATHYQNFRRWGLLGGGIARGAGRVLPRGSNSQALFWSCWPIANFLASHFLTADFGICSPSDQKASLVSLKFHNGSLQAFAKDQYGLPVFANLILLAVPIIFVIAPVLLSSARASLDFVVPVHGIAGLVGPVALV